MSRVGILLLYLVVVFAIGGAIAPWVWWGAKAVAVQVAAGNAAWADHPFYRYVHRCLLLVALVGLVPLVRGMATPEGVSFWPWRRGSGKGGALQGGVGFGGDAWRAWGFGLGLGAGMFAVALAAELGLGLRGWRAELTFARVITVAASAGLAALAVGALEEPLFRGVVCRGLSRSLGWPAAIALSSALYAWVHFLGKVPSPDPVTWTSGWRVVGSMFAASGDTSTWLPGMPTLFLAGVFLARLLQWTGKLWVPMGLHSGWVGFIKLRSALTRAVEPADGGTYESRISAGWTGLVMVLLFWVGFEVWVRWSRRDVSARLSSPGSEVWRG